MKLKSIYLTLLLLAGSVSVSQGQVLISLLFGDKLNSPNIEFGLEGGLALSSITNLDGSKPRRGFDLGFYFDFRLKNQLFLHTGVLVKSPMGADKLNPYSLGMPDLDSLMIGGDVKREINYFNVPILLKYEFKNFISVDGGVQLGLMKNVTDVFTNTIETKDDLTYDNDLTKQYNRIDVGAMAGVGYKLLKGKGMNIGVRYYYGFTDIVKDNPGDAMHNQVFYFYAGIPIGAKKAAEAEKKK